MTEFAACYTDPGVELKVQSEIEKLEIGTLLPTFVTTWICAGKIRAQEHPILGRYVLFEMRAGDYVAGIKGVQNVLLGCVTEQEAMRLMLAHVTGTYNQVRVRAANGRFATTAAQPRRKQKKRRRRPRHGKTHNPNRGVGFSGETHASYANQYAAGA